MPHLIHIIYTFKPSASLRLSTSLSFPTKLIHSQPEEPGWNKEHMDLPHVHIAASTHLLLLGFPSRVPSDNTHRSLLKWFMVPRLSRASRLPRMWMTVGPFLLFRYRPPPPARQYACHMGLPSSVSEIPLVSNNSHRTGSIMFCPLSTYVMNSVTGQKEAALMDL